MSVKVSVIVPVYGVEKYMERCARSLFAQTLDHVEFLFIDDCTPDRSMEILQAEIERHRDVITEKHWDVRTYRMPENSGQAAVRKQGISMATGQYIAHCDSDDWVEPAIFEKLYAAAQKSGADIVYGNYYSDNGRQAVARKRFRQFCPSPEALMERMMTGDENGSVWCALYSRALHTDTVLFPTGNMGEDLALNIQYLYNATQPVVLLEEPLYHYFINESSISNNPSAENIERNFRFMNQNADVVCEFFAKNKAADQYGTALKSLRLLACRPLTPLLYKKRYYAMWLQQVKTIKGGIITDFKLPLSVRFHYLCSRLRVISLLSFVKHKIRPSL